MRRKINYDLILLAVDRWGVSGVVSRITEATGMAEDTATRIAKRTYKSVPRPNDQRAIAETLELPEAELFPVRSFKKSK